MQKHSFAVATKRVTVTSIHTCGLIAGAGPETAASYFWIALDTNGQMVLSGGRGLGIGPSWNQERASYSALLRGLTWAAVNRLTNLSIFSNCVATREEAAGLIEKLSAELFYIPDTENLAFTLASNILNQLHSRQEVA